MRNLPGDELCPEASGLRIITYDSILNPIMNVLRILLLMLLPVLAGALPAHTGEEVAARSVIDALLDWNVPLARQRLTRWRDNDPGNPSLPLYGAVVKVAEADYSDATTTEIYDEPLAALKAVMASDQAFLEANPGNFSRMLSLATAEAISGRLLMEQGHWLSAYRLGKASRKGMAQVMSARPGFEDGYLILGLFEYFTGTAPAVLRWLGRLIDFTGDRDKGISYLERCVNHCKVAAAQAADALLLEIEYRPGESCRYISLGRQMVARYPGNPRYPVVTEQLLQACLAAPLEVRQMPGSLNLSFPQ